MSLTKRVAAGAAWLAAAQGLRRLFGLGVAAILARLLSPDDFGIVGLATISVGLFTSLGDIGVASALVQRLDLEPEHLDAGFTVSLLVSLLVTGLATVAAGPAARWYDAPRLADILLLMAWMPTITALGRVSEVLLQRRLAFRQLATIDAASSMVGGAVGVALALRHAGAWALVWQALTTCMGSTAGRVLAEPWLPSLRFSRRHIADVRSFSISVFGCGVVNFGIRNIDNIVVGGVLGVKALGYYTLAYNLALLPASNIGGLVTRVMFPALSSLQTDLPRFRRGYLRMLRILAMVSFPLVVGLGATADSAIRVIYGPQWGPAVPVLQVLCIVGLFESVNTSGTIFFAMGRPALLFMWGVGTFAVIAAGFRFATAWGLLGVAYAYVLLSPVVSLSPHILANRLIRIQMKAFWAALWAPLLSACLMGLFVVCLGSAVQEASPIAKLLISVPLGASAYACSMLAIGLLLTRSLTGLRRWLMGHSDSASVS